MNRPRPLSQTLFAKTLFVVFSLIVISLLSAQTHADLRAVRHISKSPHGEFPASFFTTDSATAPIGDSSLSQNGRFTVFSLTPAANDRNWLQMIDGPPPVGTTNVFAHDRRTNQTSLISVGIDDNVGDADSVAPAISANGQYVAFASRSSNLVDGVAPLSSQLFIASHNGTGFGDIEHLDMGIPDGPDNTNTDPSLSADGRFVVFVSDASNLSDLADGSFDQVYLYDRITDTSRLISIGMGQTPPDGGSINPQISGNGECIVFRTLATNIHSNGPGILVFHRLSETYSWIHDRGPASISADCRFVAFAGRDLIEGDNDGYADIYVNSLETGDIEQIDVNNQGEPSNHHSFAGYTPFISEDGRYVSFTSSAWNLVADDVQSEWAGLIDSPFPGGTTYDVFVRDRLLKTTTCLSAKPDRTPLNENSGSPWDGDFLAPGPSDYAPAISANGSTVSFVSAGGAMLGIADGEDLRNQLYVALQDVDARIRTLSSGDQVASQVDDSSWQLFKVETEEYSRLTVALDQLNFNADLYVFEDDQPSLVDYLCKSTRRSRYTDVCNLYSLEPTTWFVGIRGRGNATAFRLSARLSHAWPNGLPPTFSKRDLQAFRSSTFPGKSETYAVWVEPGHYVNTTLLLEPGGRARLHIGPDRTPVDTEDCADADVNTSIRRCRSATTRWRQLWFISVYGLQPSTKYTLRVETLED